MQKRKMQKIQKAYGHQKKQKKEKGLERDENQKLKSPFSLSSESLLDLLQKGQKPHSIDQILQFLKLKRHDKEQVRELLFELAQSGKVQRTRGGQWVSAQEKTSYIGVYSVQRSGAGFVDMAKPEQEAPVKDKDSKDNSRKSALKNAAQPFSIYIHQSNAGEAWHGDLVRVSLLPKYNAGRFTSGGKGHSKAEGSIVEVLERRAKDIMVRVGSHSSASSKSRRTPTRYQRRENINHGQSFDSSRYIVAEPCDVRFSFAVRLDTEQIDSGLLSQISPNCLLLVRPQEQIASKLWTAEVLSAHGREDDVLVQESLVKINHQTPTEFPHAALQEAESLPVALRENDYAHRHDLRGLHFVTIDGETAKDFDDAIYVEPLTGKGKNAWNLRVAIADVTHYVPLNSALDKEAKLRGNSWYFPCSVEPMLPEKLSNGLCSLNPNEDKLVMVAEMHFDQQAALIKSFFYPAVINSKARLTYTKVKKILIENHEETCQALSAEPHGKEVLFMLNCAKELAEALAQSRVKRGALHFNRPEPEYVFDDEKRIINILHKEEHFGHQLIEEFMIAANEAVAEFLEQKETQFLYRVHPEPESERLQGLFTTISTTALAHIVPKRAKASDIQAVLQAAMGTEQEYIVSRLCVRTMPQARYLPENSGHFGLASSSYCHFTSPIRRYADMVVHRALKATLAMQKNNPLNKELSGLASINALPSGHKLLALADGLNHCERAAMEAEREMARRIAVLMLMGREGQEYEGIIGGLSDFGIFVELMDMPVEGMTRIADLGDDFFEYDTERQELIGIMSGIRYCIGQRVRVRLKEANLGRLEICFTLLRAYGQDGQALPKKQAAKLKKNRGKPKKNFRKNRF